jgi:hypothetical protein
MPISAFFFCSRVRASFFERPILFGGRTGGGKGRLSVTKC